MDQVDTKGAWCHQDIEEIEKQEPGRGSENGSSRASTGIRSSKFQSRAPPFKDGRSPSRRRLLERQSPRSVGFCFGSKENQRTRSEERRVGQKSVSTCRSVWDHNQ